MSRSPLIRLALITPLLAASDLPVPAPASPGIHEAPHAGHAFPLHGGFRLLGKDGAVVLFGSDTVPGLVIAMDSPGLTAEQIEEATHSGYVDANVHLVPSGEARALDIEGGSGTAIPVTGILDGAQVEGLLAGYRNGTGQGLVMLAATTPQQWPVLAPVGEEILAGVRLFEPEPAPVSESWVSWFSGKEITYMHTSGDASGGFSDKVVIACCSDGSFHYSGRSDMSFDIDAGFGYSHDADSGAGTWTVTGPEEDAVLVLTFGDGAVRSYRLAHVDGKTYLDGERWFVVEGTRCR